MRIIRSNRVLWILQALLAALFVFAGTAKFVMDPAELAGPVASLGDVSPVHRRLRVPRRDRVDRAATDRHRAAADAARGRRADRHHDRRNGLTIMQQPPVTALFPFVTGVLLAMVFYGRLQLSPRA